MNAVDLATKLTSATAASLVNNHISHVGRYLGHSWKGLEKAEVDAIKKAGLQLFSIFEKASTSVGYFTAAQGKADALEAIGYAKELGQPTGTAIYFTVDYDAQTKDFDEILAYFQAVKANLQGFKLGCYGSFAVLNFLHSKGTGDYYFQTVAWSHGSHCSFLHLFQFQCDKQNWNNTGLNVDLVNLEKSEVGAWGQPQLKAQSVSTPVIGTVTINYPKGYGINAYNAPGGTFIKKIPGQSSWKCYGEKDNHYAIGGNLWVPKQYCTFHK